MATQANIPSVDNVSFEDLLYYASLQRQAEDGHHVETGAPTFSGDSNSSQEKHGEKVAVGAEVVSYVDDAERINARRALKQAGWASVFFLITTDILGPFNAPFAISQVGYVPGVLLYFFMGLIAFYTGILLWTQFTKLDSDKYPIRSYGDLAHRLFGTWARHSVSLLESLQLIVNVGVLCLSNGQALSQVSQAKLCFSVCIIVWTLVGMVMGQIRTLKNFGFLANSAVWINLIIIAISMGFVAHSPPNFAAAQSSLGVAPGPVVTATFVQQPIFNQVNGIMNMVFAYGGAMIFPEIMAEMRRPMDFWKGMACAQGLIFCAYMLYGVFVYSMQGQFTLPLAYQGVSKYSWQTVGNVLSLITGIIAAGLYGNIGIKVAYIHIIEDWLHGPALLTFKGRIIWSVMVVIYWALAFVVGSAIPQVQTLSGLIAAICIMQFTYTFPPLFQFALDVKTDAIQGSDGSSAPDTWRDWSRWKRGLFSGRWYFKLFNFLLFLAALSMAGLGMWGSGTAVMEVFKVSAATSFGCASAVA